MRFCPWCGVQLVAGAGFCQQCGRRLAGGAADATASPPRVAPPPGALTEETRLDDRSTPPTGPGTGLPPRAAGTATTGVFAPGTVVAGRYRIVALLGRGGMGEVYRADDLRLDQPVALKFLPGALAGDPVRLAQFHNEVRIARQVTHKNVCRIHDIGDVDGRPFLSMEYVDGEDLASLLRRIGRLPPDRATEMARQLCAGLAAAHERGVLHRDLKPANVLIDGEGRVRLTDFGIAGTALQVQGTREGTPAYMAPEQLAEGRVSVQSDLFSLGLVLYEMYTGARAIEASTLDELRQVHARGLDLSTRSRQPDLDPAIDRVIRRCLARDPADRPSSALAVAAALPGGDPIAAALAAGETPSPEMVAAAGRHGAVSLGRAAAWLVTCLAALLALAWTNERQHLLRRVPLERPPAVLADRARDIAAALGYREVPFDRTWGFAVREEVLQYLRATRRGPDRWRPLASSRLGAVVFYYRTSPIRLLPLGPQSRPTLSDPPPLVAGMVSMVLDTEGRLLQLQVVPSHHEAEPARNAGPSDGPIDWTPLLAAAGFTAEQLRPATPAWTPPVFADSRVAWTTTLPDVDHVTIRLEAASYRGRPVSFVVVGPWTRPERMEESPQTALGKAAVVITAVVVGLILLAAVVLARNNLRSGSGDRQGAARLAIAVVIVSMASWVLRAHHVPEPDLELNRFFLALADALLQAMVIWLAYLALEPFVRRRWPEGLIGWTRLLTGHWRDPLVGRDVLVGVTVGVCFNLAMRTGAAAVTWLGWPPPMPWWGVLVSLDGVPRLLGLILGVVPTVVATALLVVLLFVVMRLVLRWPPLSFAGVTVLLAMLLAGEVVTGESPAVELALVLVVSAFVAVMARRSGMLALAAMLAANQIAFLAPVVPDLGTWYAAQTLTVIGVLVTVALLAFVHARGNEPILGRRILEP